MQSFEDMWAGEEIRKVLKEGGVAVMPTDTIYGLVGKALEEKTILRIYDIKKRTPEKPFIILIGNITELEKFNVNLPLEQRETLVKYWPGPVSIILDCEDEKFSYLHRGTHTLAFRMPKSDSLQALLMEVGPLVAPSANTEALPPAEDIEQAKKYFENSVDYYMDRGRIVGKPSKLIKLNKDGTINIIRN